jgi:UDP-glucose 4-epimerase
MVAALDRGEPGQIYNIGSGEGRSNVEVLAAIEPLARASGYEMETSFLPERAFDVPANVLDSEKLTSISGWRAEVDFGTGLERTWRAVLASQRSQG